MIKNSFTQIKKLVKLQLLSGKLSRLQAIRTIYSEMPDAARGLKEARDIVDKMSPNLFPASVNQMVSQRQDSVQSQMITVVRLAEKEGCYDAADWIKHRFPGLWH